MPTRTLRNEVLPRDLPTPGICVGTLPTRRFREVFSFDALQLFCFTLKQISDAWVLVSFSFREGSETEEPQDVDEQATKESKLRTMWTDGAVGNSLGGAPLGGARSKRWTRRPAELNTRVTTWLKVYANAYAEATQRLRRSGPKQ